MPATSRHEHFIEKIEANLDTVSGLNILTEFSLEKWNSYKFPYSFTELGNEEINFPYEDNKKNQSGNQIINIWFGIEVKTNGNLRKVFSDLFLLIEKKFHSFSIARLETSDFILDETEPRVTGVYPVPNNESTKYLFAVTSVLDYDLTWK